MALRDCSRLRLEWLEDRCCPSHAQLVHELAHGNGGEHGEQEQHGHDQEWAGRGLHEGWSDAHRESHGWWREGSFSNGKSGSSDDGPVMTGRDPSVSLPGAAGRSSIQIITIVISITPSGSPFNGSSSSAKKTVDDATRQVVHQAPDDRAVIVRTVAEPEAGTSSLTEQAMPLPAGTPAAGETIVLPAGRVADAGSFVDRTGGLGPVGTEHDWIVSRFAPAQPAAPDAAAGSIVVDPVDPVEPSEVVPPTAGIEATVPDAVLPLLYLPSSLIPVEQALQQFLAGLDTAREQFGQVFASSGGLRWYAGYAAALTAVALTAYTLVHRAREEETVLDELHTLPLTGPPSPLER